MDIATEPFPKGAFSGCPCSSSVADALNGLSLQIYSTDLLAEYVTCPLYILP